MYQWDSIDFLLLGVTGALLVHHLCSGSLAVNLWAVIEREKTTFMTNLVSIFKANDKRLTAKVSCWTEWLKSVCIRTGCGTRRGGSELPAGVGGCVGGVQCTRYTHWSKGWDVVVTWHMEALEIFRGAEGGGKFNQ